MLGFVKRIAAGMRALFNGLNENSAQAWPGDGATLSVLLAIRTNRQLIILHDLRSALLPRNSIPGNRHNSELILRRNPLPSAGSRGFTPARIGAGGIFLLRSVSEWTPDSEHSPREYLPWSRQRLTAPTVACSAAKIGVPMHRSPISSSSSSSAYPSSRTRPSSRFNPRRVTIVFSL